MYLNSAELACEKALQGSLAAGREKNYPRRSPHPPLERSRELDRRLGGAKLNDSDRECKYFAVGMNALCNLFISVLKLSTLLLFLYQLHIYRLTLLSLTPRGSATALLCYWHELLDLVYFYKSTHNMIHLDPSVVPFVRECALSNLRLLRLFSCCTWFKLLLLYLYIFWVRSIGFSCCGVPALIFCLHIYSVFFVVVVVVVVVFVFVFFGAKLIK